MLRILFLLSLVVVGFVDGQELTLPKLFKESDAVCVAKVTKILATGKTEQVTFDPKKQPLPTFASIGVHRVNLEVCEVQAEVQRLLKGNLLNSIRLKTHRRAKARTVVVERDIVDEIDRLYSGRTYLLYLKKGAQGFVPATPTRFAFHMTTAATWPKTVADILKREFPLGKTYTRTENTLWLLSETLEEAKLIAFLKPSLVTGSKNVKAAALAYLMRADRPEVLEAAFEFMRKVAKEPKLSRGKPTLSITDDDDRIFWALTARIERAFTHAPGWEPDSFILLSRTLKSTNCRSLIFFNVLDTLNECAATVRGRSALNTHANACKPALIECLRTRRNSLNAGQEHTILMILSRMDRVTYVGLPEEAGWERKLSASVDRVLKKYPVGWDRKK